MKILTKWLRSYLPALDASDKTLAKDLTLRGIAVEGIFDLGAGNGSLLEMDITTNRVDAMNHYGVAREAAAIYGIPLAKLDFALPEPKPAAQAFPVQIEAEDACGRFTARVLRDVSIEPSRDWFPGGEVATYFALLEQKCISNAVDATNFAWLAMGQPTHVFDLDKLVGGIIVRRARKGERLRTLDGVDRELDPGDLIIADHAKPVGLAGVMGGWDTMITPARPTGLAWSAMIRSPGSSSRSIPSRVLRRSPLCARRTTIPPSSLSRSKACVGWPMASQAKFVASTAFEMHFCSSNPK